MGIGIKGRSNVITTTATNSLKTPARLHPDLQLRPTIENTQ
jgi:hypothetical protein